MDVAGKPIAAPTRGGLPYATARMPAVAIISKKSRSVWRKKRHGVAWQWRRGPHQRRNDGQAWP